MAEEPKTMTCNDVGISDQTLRTFLDLHKKVENYYKEHKIKIDTDPHSIEKRQYDKLCRRYWNFWKSNLMSKITAAVGGLSDELQNAYKMYWPDPVWGNPAKDNPIRWQLDDAVSEVADDINQGDHDKVRFLLDYHHAWVIRENRPSAFSD